MKINLSVLFENYLLDNNNGYISLSVEIKVLSVIYFIRSRLSPFLYIYTPLYAVAHDPYTLTDTVPWFCQDLRKICAIMNFGCIFLIFWFNNFGHSYWPFWNVLVVFCEKPMSSKCLWSCHSRRYYLMKYPISAVHTSHSALCNFTIMKLFQRLKFHCKVSL